MGGKWEREKEVKLETKTINFEWAFIALHARANPHRCCNFFFLHKVYKLFAVCPLLYRLRMSECQEMHLNICSNFFCSKIRNCLPLLLALLRIGKQPSAANVVLDKSLTPRSPSHKSFTHSGFSHSQLKSHNLLTERERER